VGQSDSAGQPGGQLVFAGVDVAKEHFKIGDPAGLIHPLRERPELLEPLPGADDYIAAEVVYAATHEGALHLEDVLARRTRISIEAWDRGVSAAPVVAKLIGEVLGWSDAQRESEIKHYLARVDAERLSQEQPDDESADAARLGVEDIVPLR
jgi:glycerol-3-phosphate dehydrogenase